MIIDCVFDNSLIMSIFLFHMATGEMTWHGGRRGWPTPQGWCLRENRVGDPSRPRSMGDGEVIPRSQWM